MPKNRRDSPEVGHDERDPSAGADVNLRRRIFRDREPRTPKRVSLRVPEIQFADIAARTPRTITINALQKFLWAR